MKFNKKLVVTSLSTILGLGIVGSISGTIAWYQYSTRAYASIIGTSAGSSGLLQIKENSQADSAYTRSLYTASLKGENANAKLYPVTFGGFAANAALPAQAYGNPEAGIKELNKDNKKATAKHDYIQFTVNLRAVDGEGTQVAKDVYISDLVLEDTSATNSVTAALRMHIACGSKYFLVGGEGATAALDTHGKLDLDGDGSLDHGKNYEWDSNEEIDYGFYSGDPATVDTTKLSCVQKAAVVNERNTDTGKLPADDAKKLGTTPTSGSLDVTVTIWLEGWELLGASDPKAIWDPATMGKTVHAGLTFDVGADAFEA